MDNPVTANKRLRVAVLTASEDEPCAWGADLLSKLAADKEHFEMPISIVLETAAVSEEAYPSHGRLASCMLKWLKNFELTKATKIPTYADYAKYLLEETQPDISIQRFRVSRRAESSVGLSHLDEISLQASEIDVLVILGSQSTDTGLERLAKLGVVSCVAADNRAFRGGPAGFWEVSNDAPSSGFTISAYETGGAAGGVLFRGNIGTETYWIPNCIRIQKKAGYFLLKTLREIADAGSVSAGSEKVVYASHIRSRPSLFALASYFIRSHVTVAASRIKAAILHRSKYKWQISWIKADGSDLVLANATTIRNASGSFLADPFLINVSEGVFCFAEEYVEEHGKGVISAFSISDDDVPKKLGVVLEESFHLSYPYVFRDRDDIYMIPEASRSGAIRLYKATDFPLKWEFVCPLIQNIRAVDTVVFKRDERWYMLTNFCSAGLGDNTSELHLFTSDDLLSGEWIPSKQNPVIFDSLRARNGGFFEQDGKLYRVNQIQGKAHYGKGCSINEIVQIDNNVYEEIEILTILPEFFPSIQSTHHFHKAAGYAVFDHQ